MLTHRLLLWPLTTLLTFLIGVGLTVSWLNYRIPSIESLEDPDCFSPAGYERAVVRCTPPPTPLSLCELASNSGRYDGKIIRARGIIVGYHHQHLYDLACLEESRGIWADFEPDGPMAKLRGAIFALPTSERDRNVLRADVVLVGRFESRVESKEHHRTWHALGGEDLFRLVILDAERVEPAAPDAPLP